MRDLHGQAVRGGRLVRPADLIAIGGPGERQVRLEGDRVLALIGRRDDALEGGHLLGDRGELPFLVRETRRGARAAGGEHGGGADDECHEGGFAHEVGSCCDVVASQVRRRPRNAKSHAHGAAPGSIDPGARSGSHCSHPVLRRSALSTVARPARFARHPRSTHRYIQYEERDRNEQHEQHQLPDLGHVHHRCLPGLRTGTWRARQDRRGATLGGRPSRCPLR